MRLEITNHLSLELVTLQHSQAIFDVAAANRDHLKEWLPWVAYMHTPGFIQNFIEGSQQRNKAGNEWAFVIMETGVVIGRIGIYKIDQYNKTGEIGYWIEEHLQGRGIVTASCKKLISYCFDDLALNRIEIRCRIENTKSRKIPERLLFTHEGVIREGEWVYDKFHDLMLYALLKKDWQRAASVTPLPEP